MITSDLSFFITDRRYTQQAHQEVQHAEIIIAQHELTAELPKIAVLGPGTKLGVEAAHLSIKAFKELKGYLLGVKIVASERIVEAIICTKTPDEVAHIRQAADICGKVFDEILALLKPGVRELDISAEISYRTRRYGSEQDPFEPIVASGQRSALPHGISSAKTLAAGELLIIDFGAVVHGYAADCTRTAVLGDLDEKQRDLTTAVLRALEAAESVARPGLTGHQVDEVARNSLKEAGYGAYFQHSLGHGLGLDVHESPRLGEKSRDVLQPGNVVTLEPGVYLPDYGGVRIEDDYLITESGVENLSPFPREVVCVG